MEVEPVSFMNVPSGQLLHARTALRSEYVPSLQGSHSFEPGLLHVPIGHDSQPSIELDPFIGLYVPAGHLSQFADRGWVAYVPPTVRKLILANILVST